MTESTSPRSIPLSFVRHVAIMLCLASCQFVSGLNDLEADGKNVSDAGNRSNSETGTSGHDAAAGASGNGDSGDTPADAGKGGAGTGAADGGSSGKAGSGGAAGKGGTDADAGTEHAAGAGGSSGTAGSGAACTPPVDSGARCDNAPQCGCRDSESCVFFTDVHGELELACRAAGSNALYAACDTQNQDCQRGYQCVDGLCQTPCEDAASQCPNPGSRCIQSMNQHGLPVTGSYTCSQTCNLVDPTQNDDTFHHCGSGHTCQVRSIANDSYTDCGSGAYAASGLTGHACRTDGDCAAGRFCASEGRCQMYCRVGGNDCLSNQVCEPLAKRLVIKDTEFGACRCSALPAGGSPCDHAQQCGCAPGDKCDVGDDGKNVCMASGSLGYAAQCTNSSDCAPGLTCLYGSCHLFCDSNPAIGCGSAVCWTYTVTIGGVQSAYTVCRGGFMGTCNNVQLVAPATLMAECHGRDPSVITTSSLDLDTGLIAKDDGSLDFSSEGGFTNTCKDIGLASDGSLVANCLNSSGEYVAVGLLLNNAITNDNGALAFD